MSAVSVTVLCPSGFETTVSGTSAASISDAAPCRRSWSRTGRAAPARRWWRRSGIEIIGARSGAAAGRLLWGLRCAKSRATGERSLNAGVASNGEHERIWIARLNISRQTAAKISFLHGLTEEEVRDEVECVEGLAFAWHDDPERGLRAIVSVWIRARPVLVVLYPASDPLGDA